MATATYLLVWNPNRWNWDKQELLKTIEEVSNGKLVTDRWSCGNTQKIKAGDRVFLIKLGQKPRGIFGSGEITTAPFIAPHWDSDLARAGKRTHFIEFQYDCLTDPTSDVVLPRSLLKNDLRFSKMHWDTQMSGVQIQDDIAIELEIVWHDLTSGSKFSLPEELDTEKTFPEGAKQQIVVNAYERNPKARKKCIEHFGARCAVCGFDFEKTYGIVGKDYIHVHHIVPLSEVGERYEVDPVRDLRPVCANCHAIIHRHRPAYTIEEVKNFLSAKAGQ